jgi:ribonuclease P protein component
MLPAPYRLRSAEEFSAVTRHGRRIRTGDVVVYLARPATADGDQPAVVTKAGLIVGRTVGGSVVRHQVSRRLRAQLASRLEQLPAGSRLVVRALPSAASARSATLGRDLDAAIRRLTAGPRR